MRSASDRPDRSHPSPYSRQGRTVVQGDELLRHPVYTRVLHWSAAGTFVLALLSGFAIYTPWLFHWLTPLFGGGPAARLLHPWFSLCFVLFFTLQFLNWRRPMSWTDDDGRWMRQLRAYVTNTEGGSPDYVDFFNAGQKVYFWTIVASAIAFLFSGIPMWFPRTFGPAAVSIGYVVHDVAALLMLVGFIVHVYEGTAVAPGTFRSMVRGTVDRSWAWTHHPAWYRRESDQQRRPDG